MNTAARRQQIFRTALILFSQKGYDQTSMRDIANHADISLGLTYNYFKNKKALLIAIVEAGVAKIEQDWPNYPAENLQQWLVRYFTILEKYRSYWLLLRALRLQSSLAKQLGTHFDELNNFIIGDLAVLLQQSGHSKALPEAILLYATLDGIATQYFTNDRYPLNKMLALLQRKYDKTISVEDPVVTP
ncbi:TetR/AcrR family transcriptional regulator [Tunicatimonas pelagia]|uniref:TetR/AcrR family transcriptional regulator n=1 Tax=Tunicatimonas pelagia TaxID=931531 RepID=UPI002665B9B7|nr:TetR/AcrR family transcriptional regulator [Tunicatimonas pelagia]WKN45911.1 TetR/AcrR family transcriptional regulator [Tunicatimonas pelagia]